MRKAPMLAVLLSIAAVAGGITLQPTTRYEFTNCAAAGSTAQFISGGTYVLRITDADTRLCLSASVAPDGGTVCGLSDGGTPGEMFPAGTVMLQGIQSAGRYVSCASATATGDVHFTLAQ